jgi:hypothetical protein
MSELIQIFSRNHLDWQDPLSPTCFANWRAGLESSTDSVTEKAEAITLETNAAGMVPEGGIVNATLTVRGTDFHPIATRFVVATSGVSEFRDVEISETAFQVLPLESLSPAFFAPTSPETLPEVKAAAIARSERSTPPATATPELEVEILNLLNEAGADLGEQVDVTRTTDGAISVQGMVETTERKHQILDALKPVEKNPAVRVQILTINEALEEHAVESATNGRIIFERADPAITTIPVDAKLRTYFSKVGALTRQQLDTKINRFANQILDRSFFIVQHAWAIKRLSERFTPEQLQKLEPPAHDKWLTMVRNHSRALKDEVALMQEELRPIFNRDVASEEASKELIQVRSVNDLVQDATRIFELSSNQEQVIRSAFAVSADASRAMEITTHDFWGSLKTLELLAANIQKMTSISN